MCKPSLEPWNYYPEYPWIPILEGYSHSQRQDLLSQCPVEIELRTYVVLKICQKKKRPNLD